MAHTATFKLQPTLKIKVYSVHEYLVLFLFIFYVLYPGLSERVPFYDRIDDVVFLMMFGLSLPKLYSKSGKVRLLPEYFWVMVMVMAVIVFSMLYNRSSPTLAIKFVYISSRPFILLLYVSVYNLPIRRVFDAIVNISKILIVYNLPMVLYNIATTNLFTVFTQYNDRIAGFFLFANVDALTWLYAIVLLKEFHSVFIRREKRFWLFVLLYFLLILAMNAKYIIMITFSIGIIIFSRSRNKLRNALLILLVFIGPVILLLPHLQKRISGIQYTTVYLSSNAIIRGKVEEHNLLVGAGPGLFTSPLAYETNSPLIYKKLFFVCGYGQANCRNVSLADLKEYWQVKYQGTPGTFTRETSSALSLFGDVGVLGLIMYVGFILLLTWRNYRKITVSYINLTGFFMGMLSFAVGFFTDNWFWGVEVFIAILAAKYAADLSKHKRMTQIVTQSGA